MRYHLLDAIRAFALIGMIIYHTFYDLDQIFNVTISWFHNTYTHYWQQINSGVFIYLSGICAHFSRNLFKRGAKVFFWGAVISLFTTVFMPDNQIYYGILTFLGTMMILTALAKKLPFHYKKTESWLLFALTLLWFIAFYSVTHNYINLVFCQIELPQNIRHMGFVNNFLGFPNDEFFSTDYFPLLPWGLLYANGYFLWSIIPNTLKHLCLIKIPLFSQIGKHSLLIYLLHQIIIYTILFIIFSVI